MPPKIDKEIIVAGSESSTYVPFQAIDKDNDNDHDNGNEKDNDKSVSPPCVVVNDPRMLDADGICRNCSSDTNGEVVCCYECKGNFHATCYEVKNSRRVYFTDNVCSLSFLKSFNTNTESKQKSKRSGNFLFHCDSCVTLENLRNAADLKTHVHTLETKMSKLDADIDTIKNLLLNPATLHGLSMTAGNSSTSPTLSPVNSIPETGVPNDVTKNPWCDSNRVEKLRHPASVIVSSAGENVPLSDLKTIITENNIFVNNTFENKAGEIVITTSSQADRTKLVHSISEKFPQSNLKQPLTKLPTISISGIRDEIEPDDLYATIMKLYPDIKSLIDSGETFSVLSVRKQRNHQTEKPMFQASVRVSNAIRKLIENRDNFLSIGLYRCKVYDHFYIKRCNKCQKFGHYSAQCKAPSHVCAHCTGDHDTNSCTNKGTQSFQPSCANCKNSKRSDQQYTHSATDRSCPAYISEQHKLKHSISYYTQKNW